MEDLKVVGCFPVHFSIFSLLFLSYVLIIFYCWLFFRPVFICFTFFFFFPHLFAYISLPERSLIRKGVVCLASWRIYRKRAAHGLSIYRSRPVAPAATAIHSPADCRLGVYRREECRRVCVSLLHSKDKCPCTLRIVPLSWPECFKEPTERVEVAGPETQRETHTFLYAGYTYITKALDCTCELGSFNVNGNH